MAEEELSQEQVLALRRQIVRELIDFDSDETIEATSDLRDMREERLRPVAWPSEALAPKLIVLNPAPKPEDPLPEADWLVITWTVEEHKALKAVFARGLPIEKWHPYKHNFATFADMIDRKSAPAITRGRIGSYCMVEIKGQRVLCLKSEFHLNQDGKNLPLLPLTKQLIRETKAKNVLSIGTAGGVGKDDELGDVMVSQSAIFKLNDEFKGKPFDKKKFTSSWDMEKMLFADAERLMLPLQEPPYAPPTKRFEAEPVKVPVNKPNILHFVDHPIITTDYFEFGTSANALDEQGCAVEMDDAVIAWACEESDPKPRYAFVRNVSDPVINADLDDWVQGMWAAGYYKKFGLETSYNSALATWAIIAAN